MDYDPKNDPDLRRRLAIFDFVRAHDARISSAEAVVFVLCDALDDVALALDRAHNPDDDLPDDYDPDEDEDADEPIVIGAHNPVSLLMETAIDQEDPRVPPPEFEIEPAAPQNGRSMFGGCVKLKGYDDVVLQEAQSSKQQAKTTLARHALHKWYGARD